MNDSNIYRDVRARLVFDEVTETFSGVRVIIDFAHGGNIVMKILKEDLNDFIDNLNKIKSKLDVFDQSLVIAKLETKEEESVIVSILEEKEND